MDTRAEVRDFLTSRRARLAPEEMGLTTYGRRQVPGLRREEVATLAGVSIDYYNRMERGDLKGVSDGVLSAIAGALRLDDAERAHLFDLARASESRAVGRRRTAVRRTVRPSVEWMVDAMTGAAAFVVNSRQDVLVANPLGRALFAPMFEFSTVANMARFTYLDPQAKEFFAQWDRVAAECVAALRRQLGRQPLDQELSDLVGELSTRSTAFSGLWAAHDVRFHRNVEKQLRHPLVGELTLRYDRLEVDGETGLEIFVYVAEPGSPSADSLGLLANWAAPDPAVAIDRSGH